MLLHSVCKRIENINLVDRILAGLCLLIIPLSFWSLWLPSNWLFLLLSLICCIIHWVTNQNRMREVCTQFKYCIKSLSKYQIILIATFILCALYFFSWEQEVYDPLIYHHQNIRWNEEFAVVPGLGNLDDKFAFNSNYFLLSAIFTFRYLVGEAIYPLQSFILIAVFGWLLKELFSSKYEIKRLLIILSYILLFGVSIYFLGNTSTDILPNIIVFYILARLLLYPSHLNSNRLIYTTIPIFLLTCKLSFFPICIISLYLLYTSIKEKKYKELSFMICLGALIIVPWLIRNVIVSGYLVYPIYQIDLFSFDWKVPHEIAIQQKKYIFDVGYYFFRIALRYPDSSIRDPFYINVLTDIIYLLAFISFALTTYHLLKRRKEKPVVLNIIYSAILLSLLVWVTGGPDLRFIVGILCFTACIYPVIISQNKYYPLFGKSVIILFICGLFSWSSIRIYNFQSESYHSKVMPSIVYKPYSIKDQKRDLDIFIDKQFRDYPLNNSVSIKVTSDLLYDIFPSTIESHYAKFLGLDRLEARGNHLQDGFRAK